MHATTNNNGGSFFNSTVGGNFLFLSLLSSSHRVKVSVDRLLLLSERIATAVLRELHDDQTRVVADLRHVRRHRRRPTRTERWRPLIIREHYRKYARRRDEKGGEPPPH